MSANVAVRNVMKRRRKHQIGMACAIVAIVILVGQEAFSWLLRQILQVEMTASNYSRLIFSIPVSIFFFLGHKWALWLFRIGFSLGILSSMFLLAVLVDGEADSVMLAFTGTSLIGYILGTWIVFGSESFKSYIRSRRRGRGLYD